MQGAAQNLGFAALVGRGELGDWEVPSHGANPAFSAGKRARGGNGKKTLNMFEAKSVFLFKQTFVVEKTYRIERGEGTVKGVGG